MKLTKWLAAGLVVLISGAAQAVVVGNLSRADGSDTIVDSLNHREWLGWDVTRNLNYTQTVAAIGVGGRFQGYSIARNHDAQLFVDAMVGPNDCTEANVSEIVCVRNANNVRETLVGETYRNYYAMGYTYDYDYIFFLSDNGIGAEAGSMFVVTHQTNDSDAVGKGNETYSIAAANGYIDGVTIGWLLYKEAGSTVPEPSSLMLFGLALAGIAATRRRKIA